MEMYVTVMEAAPTHPVVLERSGESTIVVRDDCEILKFSSIFPPWSLDIQVTWCCFQRDLILQELSIDSL